MLEAGTCVAGVALTADAFATKTVQLHMMSEADLEGRCRAVRGLSLAVSTCSATGYMGGRAGQWLQHTLAAKQGCIVDLSGACCVSTSL